MKRHFARMLTALLLLALLPGLFIPARADSGVCGPGVIWEYDVETATLTISGQGKMAEYGYDMPWKRYSSSIRTIIIREGVRSIGTHAFVDCSAVRKVVLPEGLEMVGRGAFEDCTGLESIQIPEGVKTIEGHAFWGCTGLESIQIPEGVKTIESCAFWGCTGLTEVVIPDSVEEIQREAFRNCTGLTEITFPENAYVDETALLGCVNIKGYAWYAWNASWNAFWKALPGVLIDVGSTIISIASLVIAVIWVFTWSKQWLEDRKEAGKTFPWRKILRTGLIILAVVVGYMGFTAVVNKLLGR